MICANCNQDNPGQEYSFSYGKVVEERANSTRYTVEGRRSVFICDACTQKHFTARSRGSWLSLLVFALCLVGLILLADRAYTVFASVVLWILGILCVASLVMAIVFMLPLTKLLAQTRASKQSSIKGKQEAMERLAITLARPAKEYVCFTERDILRMSPAKGDD